MGVSSTKFLLQSLFLALLLCVLAACEMFWLPHSPRGYIMPKPHRIILEKKLNEISGLFYLPGENAMLAIADDKRKIYRLTPDGQVSNYFEQDFFEQQDFEDVVKVDDVVYALISNGTILSIRNTDSGLVVSQHPFPSTEKTDFETVYYDPAARGLIMVCKSCAFEKGEGVRTAFRFDLATRRFDSQPYYTIESKAVRDILKDGKIDFNPSGAAIHPIEKRLYILSSAGQLLVITDTKGRVQEAYRLKPNFYPQAEGIAFAANGDMFISNEAKYGKPSLMVLQYKPTGNQQK